MKSEFIHKFESLPRSIQQEIINYIEQLILKYKKTTKNTSKKQSFNFNGENGLLDIKKQYTSVELQHHASKLR